jgi:hypothetical protein
MPKRSIDINKAMANVPITPTESVREWPLIRGHFAGFLVSYNLGELEDIIPPELDKDQHEDWMLGRATYLMLDGLRSTRLLIAAAMPTERGNG